MKNYLIGMAFLIFGGYRLYLSNLLETFLYFSVGIGFILMGAAKDEKFEKFHKKINVASWIFVIGGVILFIAVLRRDAYGW